MKKFELLSTQPLHGSINIPVFGVMTKKDVSEAIFKAVEERSLMCDIKQLSEIERFCNALQNDDIFIDPANSEDCFVLAFGFKSYTRPAVAFACVLLFAMFGESIINSML